MMHQTKDKRQSYETYDKNIIDRSYKRTPRFTVVHREYYATSHQPLKSSLFDDDSKDRTLGSFKLKIF